MYLFHEKFWRHQKVLFYARFRSCMRGMKSEYNSYKFFFQGTSTSPSRRARLAVSSTSTSPGIPTASGTVCPNKFCYEVRHLILPCVWNIRPWIFSYFFTSVVDKKIVSINMFWLSIMYFSQYLRKVWWLWVSWKFWVSVQLFRLDLTFLCSPHLLTYLLICVFSFLFSF